MYEVRFKGEWMGFFQTVDDANDFVRERRELDAEHAQGFTVAPVRRFHVVCRGNVVTTEDTIDGATGKVETLASERTPPNAWQIFDSVSEETFDVEGL